MPREGQFQQNLSPTDYPPSSRICGKLCVAVNGKTNLVDLGLTLDSTHLAEMEVDGWLIVVECLTLLAEIPTSRYCNGSAILLALHQARMKSFQKVLSVFNSRYFREGE